MDVPLPFCIVDDRKPSELKTMTISRYKRTEVIKALHKAMLEGNLERACLWTAELHASGKADFIWKELLEAVPGYVNKANPHLMSWIWYKFHIYEHLLTKFTPKYRHEHRNNQEIRNLLVDVVAVVTISAKNDLSKGMPKVPKTELQVKNYKKRMVATSLRHIVKILNQHDPSEIRIAINEVVNQFGLVDFKLEEIIYWYLWLEQMQKSKKEWEPFICFPHQEPEENPLEIDRGLVGDWVWAFWRAIRNESRQRSPMVQDQIEALYEIYQWKYTKTAKKRKQNVLFAACALLCDDTKWDTKMIQNVKLRIQACSNSNILYRLIDEKLDPTRQVSRTEFYAFIHPLVSKKTAKKGKTTKKKAKEEIKKEKSQIIKEKKVRYFTDLMPTVLAAPSDPVIIEKDYDLEASDEPEYKIVKVGV